MRKNEEAASLNIHAVTVIGTQGTSQQIAHPILPPRFNSTSQPCPSSIVRPELNSVSEPKTDALLSPRFLG